MITNCLPVPSSPIPEFLSTHPSDVTRINPDRGLDPDAMKHYHPAGKAPAIPSGPIQPYRPPVGPMPEAPPADRLTS